MSKARQLAQKPSQPTGRKNLIINGAMEVAQRLGGATTKSTSENAVFITDRWDNPNAGTSSAVVDYSIESDVPSGTGFANSFKIKTNDTYTTTATTLRAFRHKWEGQDLQHIQKGTANALPLTASFWVKSNTTGNIVVELLDRDSAFRHICALVEITVADTWEYKTVTFDGDTTGALDDDTNASLDIAFYFSMGSNYTSGTLATSWASYVAGNRAAGISLAGGDFGSSTNNYIQFTGVQLEVGSTATEFEHRSFGEELRLCQRYYYMVADGAVDTTQFIGSCYAHTDTDYRAFITMPVSMRANPSLENPTVTDDYRFVIGGPAATTDTVDDFFLLDSDANSKNFVVIRNNTDITDNNCGGRAGYVQLFGSSSHLALDAEI